MVSGVGLMDHRFCSADVQLTAVAGSTQFSISRAAVDGLLSAEILVRSLEKHRGILVAMRLGHHGVRCECRSPVFRPTGIDLLPSLAREHAFIEGIWVIVTNAAFVPFKS